MKSLGEPDDVSVSKKPTIWKYGRMELTFDREWNVAGLVIEVWQRHLGLPAALEIAEDLSSTSTEEETVAEIRARGGSPVEERRYADESHWRVLESNVTLTFDNGLLWWMGLYARD